MKKVLTSVLICICLVLSLAGCSKAYDEADFIGKSSLEIIREYGEFDCVLVPAGEDGAYRSCRCGYTVKEVKSGFFGTSEERLFFILFDENGLAIDCEEGYRPGG